MAHKSFAVLTAAGLLLAQLATGTYLGTPSVPGTRTPEQSPATAVAAPAGPPATVSPVAPGEGAGPVTTAPQTTPGLSFGAAPPPVVSPTR